ncbi:Aldehyde dehydrogenase [Mycena sanguinolenta]|uniref:aldehyde dehydrogenase (NAD(+)) n=1 Tax=Mycena sanguinolenta TaxID=230812 RepID=A0A8H6ZFP8_9AGAR|nr:Aldehyde dehydrogenase [Mycena sanguinolenta]
MAHFTHDFQTASYTGKVSFPTGLFIGGEFVDGAEGTKLECVSSSSLHLPSLVSSIVSIAAMPLAPSLVTIHSYSRSRTASSTPPPAKSSPASPKPPKPTSTAQSKPRKRPSTPPGGLNASGAMRAELINKLASLMDKYNDELCAIEALDNGKTFTWAKNVDVAFATATFKYYAGWADKISGQTIETDEKKLVYTRHEPIGVVGQIIPWNFPLLMFSWKVAPALATGNTIVLKPSEFTPLTAIRMCSLIKEAGFPARRRERPHRARQHRGPGDRGAYGYSEGVSAVLFTLLLFLPGDGRRCYVTLRGPSSSSVDVCPPCESACPLPCIASAGIATTAQDGPSSPSVDPSLLPPPLRPPLPPSLPCLLVLPLPSPLSHLALFPSVHPSPPLPPPLLPIPILTRLSRLSPRPAPLPALLPLLSPRLVAFTGSTLVGRKVMAAAAASNLKNVTLELGGKSPNIVFDDADLEQAVGWAAHGIFWNHGQACCAGSRIYVQEGIYDKFLEMLTERTKKISVGDPFKPGVDQGPQVSQQQYDVSVFLPPSSPSSTSPRIMDYINSGKKDGAKVHIGGNRHGTEGYFIEPTIFTETKEDMKIVKEEIFGPVGVVIKFKDEADVLRQANDTVYGLASAVFTQDINRAIETAHKLQAGTAWINCVNHLHANVPFGGFKQSGIGRELGEYALHNYTNVKAVHVNLGHRM